jgi:hypothetical protein
MRKYLYAAASAVAVLAMAPAAHAAIVIGSVTPGTVPYSGPTPTYDFETPAPWSGGIVTNTSVAGVRAQPLGSTGNYWSVGPTDGSPGILDLSSFGDINDISFIWGSVDSYNTLEFLAGNTVLATFTGTDVFNPANGNQTDPNLNPLVRFNITGSDSSSLTGLRLTSTSNAFETDNYTVNAAVPEPSTWAMMLLGFGAIGFGMRRRKAAAPRVNYNFA